MTETQPTCIYFVVEVVGMIDDHYTSLAPLLDSVLLLTTSMKFLVLLLCLEAGYQIYLLE